MGRIPEVPSGVLPDTGYDKLNSTTPEQKHMRSAARPQVRQWASASYNPSDGRGARVADDPWAGKTRHGKPESWKQMPSGSAHPDYSADKKPTKPGRW